MNADNNKRTSNLAFGELCSAATGTLDSLPNLIFIISADNCRIQYLNGAVSAWLKTVGFDDPSAVLGKHSWEIFAGWKELVHPMCQAVRECSTSRLFKDYEIETAGRIACWDVALIPNMNAAGEAVSITCILSDVTDRKAAETAVRRSEEQYRELVQGINSVVLRWDRYGVITFINDFGQRLFGYSSDELVGRNVMGTIVPETDASGHNLRMMIRDNLEHPDTHAANVNQNMRSDGELIWMAWHQQTETRPGWPIDRNPERGL